ncbi:AP-3 complex subunit beta-1-like isoform X2 [Labeo rohita]|uniref:AP-3 complex subunit beta-1-like isoform X2 n=1 Tax=Labeo rohita TaxID=84645 RepID=A0A498NN50_LABRO|nr:AP-3 complex subunit beta-1-like isoform X2 [Labeo rohita]
MTGKGLSAQYRFTRQPCIYGNSMVSLQLTLSNSGAQALENIHISEKSSTGQNIHRFNAIELYSSYGFDRSDSLLTDLSLSSERLEQQASITVSMGVDFNDSTQAANFQLCTKEDEFNVSVQPAVGELLLPVTMSEADFTKEQGKLVGMNESSATITMTPENVSSQSVNRKVVTVANLGVIPSSQDNIQRFAGKTVSSGSLVLVSVVLKDPDAVITVNTEKTVMGSMLLRQLKTALTNSAL